MQDTGGKGTYYLSFEEFSLRAREYIQAGLQAGRGVAIATLDLNCFNYINDLFGFAAGDMVLKKMGEHFLAHMEEGELFTRVYADVFAFCLGSTECGEVSRRFTQMAALQPELEEVLPAHYSVSASGGIVVVEDEALPISAYLDKANYARLRAKESLVSSYRFYDEKMRGEIQWQKMVTFAMEAALEKREFEMYLQPKLAIQSDQIVGAEALVRWNHPQHGLISPDRFIPILEQNGFICQVDFFMLEEACRFLKQSGEKGLPQLPISINFSKIHLHSEKLVEQIFQTVNRMGIPTGLIEIEFTESLSVEGFERLIEVVADLKMLGFRVSLDDFGSAYSSLSCLKELPIDIIKIDKGFLDASSDSEKGKLIISKVVELIKSLRMASVMEGVETEDQVEFLRKLSCDFGQGYFYAKPMPVADYVDYLQKGSLFTDVSALLEGQGEVRDKGYLNAIPQEFQMDNWELYTLGKNIDMGLMKGYLDGEATVQYVNDRALEYLEYTRQEFREVFHNSIVAFTHPEDAPIVQKNAEQLITTGKPLQFKTRAIRKDGKVITLQGRSSCVIDSRGRPVGLYAFQDVTEEQEQVETLRRALEDKIRELEATVEVLRLSEERYRVIVEQSDDILFDWEFASDTVYFSDKYQQLLGREPIYRGVAASRELRRIVHPEDLPLFEAWLAQVRGRGACQAGEFRVEDHLGRYLWVRVYSTTLRDKKGRPLRAVGRVSDINAQREEMDALTYKSQRDPLTKLLNKGETMLRVETLLEEKPDQPGAFYIIDIDNFKEVNDNLGHLLGDAILVEFSRRIQNLFPPDSVVGRIGGDEIAVYLQGIEPGDIPDSAEALMQSLRMTYYGSATKYNVYGSAGVAFYPGHGETFEELYRSADVALYESKRGGKDRYTLYEQGMTGALGNNRTPVEWSERFLNAYFHGDIPFQIFEMLYETRDMNTSVGMILELLGTRFQVDRVYIFQNDPDGRSLSNTHEWCGPGISAEIQGLQNIPREVLDTYFKQYSKEGVYVCRDIREADGEVRALCSPQGIKSMLHCAVYNERVMAGFIGFDMCRDYHDWTGEEIAILGYLSRILSVFLIKSDMALELRTSYQNYVEMLRNLNGYVYVVDPVDYQLLYINPAIRKLGLETGGTCHKMAFGRDTPCENCPVRRLSDTVHFATEEIYSQVLGSWVSAAASKMKWEGTQDAVLLCCTDISKYKAEPGKKA